MKSEVRREFISRMRDLTYAVEALNDLYYIHPELNDNVDISKLIPYSLDEWHCDLRAFIDNYTDRITK